MSQPTEKTILRKASLYKKLSNISQVAKAAKASRSIVKDVLAQTLKTLQEGTAQDQILEIMECFKNFSQEEVIKSLTTGLSLTTQRKSKQPKTKTLNLNLRFPGEDEKVEKAIKSTHEGERDLDDNSTKDQDLGSNVELDFTTHKGRSFSSGSGEASLEGIVKKKQKLMAKETASLVAVKNEPFSAPKPRTALSDTATKCSETDGNSRSNIVRKGKSEANMSIESKSPPSRSRSSGDEIMPFLQVLEKYENKIKLQEERFAEEKKKLEDKFKLQEDKFNVQDERFAEEKKKLEGKFLLQEERFVEDKKKLEDKFNLQKGSFAEEKRKLEDKFRQQEDRFCEQEVRFAEEKKQLKIESANQKNSFQEQLQKQDARWQEQEFRINRQEDQYAKLTQLLTEFMDRTSKLEQENKEKDQKSAELEATINQLNSANQVLKERIQVLEKDSLTLTEENKLLKEENQGLERLQLIINEHNTAYSELIEKCKMLEVENLELKEQLDNFKKKENTLKDFTQKPAPPSKDPMHTPTQQEEQVDAEEEEKKENDFDLKIKKKDKETNNQESALKHKNLQSSCQQRSDWENLLQFRVLCNSDVDYNPNVSTNPTKQVIDRKSELGKLNSTIIDKYLALCRLQNASDCWILDTIQMVNILNKSLAYPQDLNLQAKKYIICPIYRKEGNGHWALLILENQKGPNWLDAPLLPASFYLDSAGYDELENVGCKVLQYLQSIIAKMYRKSIGFDCNIKAKKVPVILQSNNIDCGVWLLYNLSLFLKAADKAKFLSAKATSDKNKNKNKNPEEIAKTFRQEIYNKLK